MPIRFFCPECQAKLTVSRRFAGQRGKCPSCKTKVQVPDILLPELAIAGDKKPKESVETGKKFPAETNATTDPDSAPVIGQSSGELETISNIGVEDSPDQLTKPDRTSSKILKGELVELVSVPRWVVYLQGAMLGIIATSFFVFGFAVGNHTKALSRQAEQSGRCQVTGTVYYDEETYRRADPGSVVILLPADRKPQERPESATLRPNSFKPLDNESIQSIRDLGGAVVRVNDDGSFQTMLDNKKSYWILVISKNKKTDNEDISKQTRAELGAYFFPIEDLLQDQAFSWSQVRITGQSQKLESVVF